MHQMQAQLLFTKLLDKGINNLDEKIVGFMDEEEMRVSIEHGIMK